MRKVHRVALTAYAAIIAISAYAGAVGLAGGSIEMTPTVDHRLPFHSPVFGALALALIVGVPNTLLAVYAWRGDSRTDAAAFAAGVLLVGWIAVEIAFIRELSWLQPAYVAVGAGVIMIGRRGRAAGPGGRSHGSRAGRGPGRRARRQPASTFTVRSRPSRPRPSH
jgi:hypothetical protein